MNTKRRLNIRLEEEDVAKLFQLRMLLKCASDTETIRLLVRDRYAQERKNIRALNRVYDKRQEQLPHVPK